MSIEQEFKKITTRAIVELKRKGIKITALTAYDYLIARLLDRAGIDIILVGDSLGNVFQGNDTTLPVTLDEMIYHTKAVMKGVKRAMVIVDMPFMSFQNTVEEAFKNAGRIMKETGASGVKLEGGKRIADAVRKITEAGIPVIGHLGLTPQSIHQFGGYLPRGKSEEESKIIMEDAKILEQAGVFALVLEKVPAELGKKISESLTIPTIGIGAGPHCDGQILVVYDMLGLIEDFHPRFVRKYENLSERIFSAFKNYINDVRKGEFPSENESY
jgi:3-methyl-2-oxobutanoate hydroxymethyltransferase